jgi:hypothetical protein
MKASEFVSEGFFDKLATGTKKFLDKKQQNLYDRVKKQYPDADETTIMTIVKGLGDPSMMAKINDPQVLKKAELMQKHGITPDELASKVKQRADRKPIEKSIQRQKQKLRKQGNQQPTTQKVNTPPIGAVLPSKQYGDIVFKGNMWTSRDGVVKFNSPDAIKNLNRSYLQAKQAGVI